MPNVEGAPETVCELRHISSGVVGRTKKPRAMARGFQTDRQNAKLEAAVPGARFTLQVEPDLGIRIGAEILAAAGDAVGLVRRLMGGTGQRGRGNRGRERCKNDEGLHLTAPNWRFDVN